MIHREGRARLDDTGRKVVIAAAASLITGAAVTALIMMLWLRLDAMRDDPVVEEAGENLPLERNQGAARVARLLAIARHAGFEIRRVLVADAQPASFVSLINAADESTPIDMVDLHPALALPVDASSALVMESEWPERNVLRQMGAMLLGTLLASTALFYIYMCRSAAVPRVGTSGSPAIDAGRRMLTLTAIHHDLRAPLTRLRLRADRAHAGVREGLLREVQQMDRMLEGALQCVLRSAVVETPARVDLAALMRTVCSEFADVGYRVTYRGPARLAWTCPSDSLSRAIGNIVDNAVRHATAVEIALSRRADCSVEIDISDDGPGIPLPLREQVFEPFFTTTSATHERRGYGLGLSIAREIVLACAGSIVLLDHEPRGLIVRVRLPDGCVPAKDSG